MGCHNNQLVSCFFVPIMKTPNLLYFAGASLFLCAATAPLAAQSVSTTPVGYTTQVINGSPDGTTVAFTALSTTLEVAPLLAGSFTADPTSAVLTDANASNTVDAYAGTDPLGSGLYYLQVTGGASDGLIVDIIANTATTFTAGGDMTGLVASGDTYVVKQHVNLAGIFGADNSAGLQSGGDASTSDLIYLMSTDGVGSYSTFYYQTDPFGGALGGDGWRIVGDASTDMSTVSVASDDGLLVARTGVGDLEVVTTGSVNDVDHLRVLPAGYSLVAYPFPVDVSLDESGIYSATNGYVSAGDSAASDEVLVISSNGVFTTYYRQTDPFGGALGGDGWRVVGDASTDQGSTLIPAGSSIVIYHKGSGLNWADTKPFKLVLCVRL